MDMDWRMRNLYLDHFYGYTITQSWWQKLKGRITGRYEIRVRTPDVDDSDRTYLLTPDHQEDRPFDLQLYMASGNR